MLLRGGKARKHPQKHPQSAELVLAVKGEISLFMMHNMNVLFFYRVQHMNFSVTILQVASCISQWKTTIKQALQNQAKIIQVKAQENSLYHCYNKNQTPIAKYPVFFLFP